MGVRVPPLALRVLLHGELFLESPWVRTLLVGAASDDEGGSRNRRCGSSAVGGGDSRRRSDGRDRSRLRSTSPQGARPRLPPGPRSPRRARADVRRPGARRRVRAPGVGVVRRGAARAADRAGQPARDRHRASRARRAVALLGHRRGATRRWWRRGYTGLERRAAAATGDRRRRRQRHRAAAPEQAQLVPVDRAARRAARRRRDDRLRGEHRPDVRSAAASAVWSRSAARPAKDPARISKASRSARRRRSTSTIPPITATASWRGSACRFRATITALARARDAGARRCVRQERGRLPPASTSCASECASNWSRRRSATPTAPCALR